MPDDSTKSPEASHEPANDSAWPPHQATPRTDTNEGSATTEPITETPVQTGETTVDNGSMQASAAQQSPVVPVVPTSQTVAEQPPVAVEPELAKNTPGTLVLQWLTYAFWGWTILALAWLTAASISFFVNRDSYASSDNSIVAYSLAAVIVLFVISLICDFFYSKREPLHKHGAATVIMIIHAVIFALFGIGSLIVAVFAVVRMLIGDSNPYDSGDDGSVTMLTTGLIIAVVYGATLLRTLRPFKLKRSSPIYWLFMSIVTITVTVLGVVGPTAFASQTRDDRLIERSLNEVSESIRNYTDESGKLPASLDDVADTMSTEAQDLVNRKLVDYTPGEQVAQAGADTSALSGTTVKPIVRSNNPVYKYKLCVTYKAKRGSGSIRPSSDNVNPDTYSHAAGRVCYSLVTDYSYNYNKLY